MVGTRITCHECGLEHHKGELPTGTAALCRRCGSVLYRHRPPTFERALALTLAGAILFVVANVFPFLGIRIGSIIQETTLITGTIELYQQGKWILSLVVCFTSIVAPGVQLALLLYVLVPAYFGRTPPHLARAARLVMALRPWAMMDVFMLAILVSAVKLADLATLLPGVAMLSFMVLIFVLAGAQAAIDTDRIWAMVPVPRQHASTTIRGEPLDCEVCHLTVAAPATRGSHTACPRCHAPLHHRKPDSLQRTWALLIAAVILYIPANLLPVMYVTTLGVTESDTIMSGVLYFLDNGMWYLALVIFTASIFVPFVKIGMLTYLLVSVHRRSTIRPRQRTRIYRMTEAVGRWSMVDVFVVSILVALVEFGNLSDISAGWGAVFFAGVVILTMLAAMSFDPRLIWDALDEEQNGRLKEQHA